jgi:hypothetical protein
MAYYKTTVIMVVCDWQKGRDMDEWNKIKSPEIDPHKVVNWFCRLVQRQFNGERIILSTNGAGIIACSFAKEKINLKLNL